MGQAAFSALPQYILDVDAVVVSQSITGNYSTIYWRVIVHKTAGSGYWSGASPNNWGNAACNVGPLWNVASFAYDFRNGSNSGSWTYAEGYVNIPHNADGTGSYYVDASMGMESLGTASTGTGTRALTRIPRGPRVKVAGVWKNTIAYIKVSDVWKIAIPFVKTGGLWKIGGG